MCLDEVASRRLARLAEQEGVSQSELLRRAIRAYVPGQRTARVFQLDGVGAGPDGSVVDLSDSELTAGFAE